MLVIVSGVSGAGKNTVIQELIKHNNRLTTLPSYTNRPIRATDIPGETYYFVTTDDFEKMIRNHELYEFSKHHDHYYGTSKKLLDDRIKQGNIIIKDIDVNGAENLVSIFNEHLKVITIFLKVSKEELRYRLNNREDRPSEEEINLRLGRFDYEESKIPFYDYVIKNDNLEKTIKIIETILKEEYK